MADFVVPALGADMESGKVVHWLVAPGSRVRSGDVVVVLETHKGAFDCEIFLDGIIEDLAPEGTELPVGAVLAHVRTAGEAPAAAPVAPAPPAPLARSGQAAPEHGHAEAPTSPALPQPASTRARVTPAARRRARDLGIDIGAVAAGLAPGRAVSLRELEAAAKAAGPPPGPAAPRGTFDAHAMRQGIAIAMARSKREIPHYYLASTIDFSAAAQWLAAYNAQQLPQDRLLAAVLLLKASAVALARHPQFNGLWQDGGFRPGAGLHVGWAVGMRGGGLVAPAIHDVDRKPLPVLMREMRDLVQRVRGGGLRSSEMTDPTVTVTNLGDRGADRVLGVIYPPQVALIGFGAVLTRPWVEGGQVVARPLVEASLAADHRATDGHAGSLLLAAIADALQHPGQL